MGSQTVMAGEPPAGSSRWTVSFKGFGPVKFGMTVREAEKALKMRLAEEQTSEACHYASNEKELRGAAFMVIDGKVARVDVYDAYRTDRGARIGMSEAEIRSLYPGIQVEPHHYDPTGHYLVVTSADGQTGIVFETDGKVVTDFRAGQREPVGYVEGCL